MALVYTQSRWLSLQGEYIRRQTKSRGFCETGGRPTYGGVLWLSPGLYRTFACEAVWGMLFRCDSEGQYFTRRRIWRQGRQRCWIDPWERFTLKSFACRTRRRER